VLVVEDDPRDAEMITHAMTGTAPGISVHVVDTRAEFVRALDKFVPDIILSGHAVANFDVREAFRLAQSRAPGSPFIVVAGRFEQRATECLQAGAADFVPKAEISRLGPAIATALSLRRPLRRLTHRQREVLQRLAAGRSTREIAVELDLSVKTVETHRAQLMNRLGIHTIAGLVRYAVRVGIISAGQS